MIDFVTLVLAILATGFMFLWLYLTRNRGYIETLGLPVDPPLLFLGSG